ncbi:MAG: hypothetical protein IPK26_21345 [Planctomycetes bacterium]|nr:hypothetical protein [Planctomycetota bacterium]
MARIADEFARRNPGYGVAAAMACQDLPRSDRARLAFVQRGRANARVGDGTAAIHVGEVAVGDLVVLPPGQGLRADAPLDLVVFTVPDTPADVPTFVRPDHDPKITDTPGGCATETGAYRRILLTWQRAKGPYTFHGLNAHRVRIDDSFSHYHPVVGGFDEFYLVQMTQGGARLLTSDRVDRIELPDHVTNDEARSLLQTTPLQVGDLVYLPRGLMHRGLGGALVQVITVPGFVPGAEIGVDHHLRRIGERLGLSADELPYHEPASHAPVVR